MGRLIPWAIPITNRIYGCPYFLLTQTVLLFRMEDAMNDTKLEKAMKPLPVPYEEFEIFPKQVQDFFDMIARRPYELLEKRPFLFGREFENLLKFEPEIMRPIHMKLYETEETLMVRAEVPGFTEKELNVVCEPWRLVITGKKEYMEEGKAEKKEEPRGYSEKMQIYKSVKLPLEIKPENVKAVLKHGILELTLPKAEVVKKIKIEVKPL
jgi:HSP20 family protein